MQASSREDLKRLFCVVSGGIVFTTIQKFLPEESGGVYPTLTERRNVVVIADEAHRSQYDFIDGFARRIRDDLAFFQAIKARFAKFDEQTKTRSNEEIETAIRQIVNDAIISGEVVDIFDAAGIKKPDISILSEEFLAEIQGMERKNLALELLKRLLNDEIKTRSKVNLVQGRKFSEMLAEAVKRYQSGLVDSAKIIEELIHLAKDLRAADQRGEKLKLRVDELAFYDALAENSTAEAVLGDQTLKQIAHELVNSVRNNTSIDWQLKQSVQAKLRVMVKRILRKYKYPPDDPATGEYTVSVTKVLDQAELLADYWTKEK